MDESINIYKCQFLANSFHLFVAGAKAALYPFLTFYFRYLGLSATQTGVVIACKACIPLLSTPLWLFCVCRSRNKRGLLMMSVFVTMMAIFLLSLVPSTQNTDDFCLPSSSAQKHKEAGENSAQGFINSVSSTVVSSATSTSIDQTQANVNRSNASSPGIPTSTFSQPLFISSTTSSTTTKLYNAPMTDFDFFKTSTTPLNNAQYDQIMTYVMGLSNEQLQELGITDLLNTTDETKIAAILSKVAAQLNLNPILVTTDSSGLDTNHKVYMNLSPQLKAFLAEHGINEEMIENLTPEVVQFIVNEAGKTSGNSESRHKRSAVTSVFESFTERISSFKEMLIQYNNMPFILVLGVIILGELLSCPIEKLADKMWFDFTDGVDMLEKYGTHKSWSFLGWIFMPVIVSGLVDYTDCYILGELYHFSLHFYAFGALLGLAFIWAFMFPTMREKKRTVHRHNSVWKGVTFLCSDVRGASYCLSLLVLGVASAGIDNFLMWRVQDLGGGEVILGGAVSLGAFTSLVVHFLLRWIVYKLGNAGAVVLALFTLALRLLAYAYMSSPWVVLALGGLAGISNTLLLGAVETYPDFKVNPYVMDRSAKALASALYTGVAYSGGSLLSGLVYDSAAGLRSLYLGCAAVAAGWALLFALVHRCARRSKRNRYARLLQAEEDQDSEGSEECSEDDWLQTALKHDK